MCRFRKGAWHWRKRAWRWRKRAWRGAIVKVARGNTIPSKTLKHPWPSGKTTVLVNQRLWLLRSFGLDSKWRPSLCMTIAIGGK